MGYKTLTFQNIDFDDFIIEKEGGVWSQVCKSCVEKNKIASDYLAEEGDGICGVVGCTSEADHYVDFSLHDVVIS